MRITFLLMLLTLSVSDSAIAEDSRDEAGKNPASPEPVTAEQHLQRPAVEAGAVKDGRRPNDLINESSPYLLQHAYNRVNWHAWGEAAFEKARKENKPIFLSIGYSTCHWCHVMAAESFDNKKIADFLNSYFVCIKVDREQRPDIDAVYLAATRIISGYGGWPMNVFLDNQLRPFHAATYYPPFSSVTKTGFYEVITQIQLLWKEQPELIDQLASKVTEIIAQHIDDTSQAVKLSEDVYTRALAQIEEIYDDETGGFSAAPKFPRPGIFAFLNQQIINQSINKQAARKMLNKTLDAMAAGGIYDQLAGGFHRYSVDEYWQLPHFEKMLYTQALMVLAYSDYYQLDAREEYRALVFATLKFVMQEMRSPDGGFYSALDADSETSGKPGEHAEGAYYLWQSAELKKILTDDEFAFTKNYYSIQDNGNIFTDPSEEFADLNVLHVNDSRLTTPLTTQQNNLLMSSREKLIAYRQQRPKPHLDDKIITAWNGMMISAFSRASVAFDNKDFLRMAEQGLVFVRKNLYDNTAQTLFRQYRNQHGVNKPAQSAEATLADYAWLIYSLLEVYQAGANKRWLHWALELQKKQHELFFDKSSQAYFESSASDANILFRSKTIHDGALPAANAITLSNLRSFAELSGSVVEKNRYNAQAEALIGSFAETINHNPSAAAMLLAIESRAAKTMSTLEK
jgi:hypothetical protein